jgi:hypothetical protein
VRTFRLSHALHIRLSFSESLGISNILLSLGFWYSASWLNLVGFSDTDFVGCRINRKSTSGICHFFGLLLFAGLLKNNLQLLNPLQRMSV